jgi:hypothetical protein
MVTRASAATPNRSTGSGGQLAAIRVGGINAPAVELAPPAAGRAQSIARVGRILDALRRLRMRANRARPLARRGIRCRWCRHEPSFDLWLLIVSRYRCSIQSHIRHRSEPAEDLPDPPDGRRVARRGLGFPESRHAHHPIWMRRVDSGANRFTGRDVPSGRLGIWAGPRPTSESPISGEGDYIEMTTKRQTISSTRGARFVAVARPGAE